MKSSWFRNAVVVLALTATGFVLGCGSDVDGKYRDPEGVVKLELKDGKATIDLGAIHIDGKYTVDGDKVTIKPEGGPNPDALVLTIGKDGSLNATTQNMLFSKLVKEK